MVEVVGVGWLGLGGWGWVVGVGWLGLVGWGWLVGGMGLGFPLGSVPGLTSRFTIKHLAFRASRLVPSSCSGHVSYRKKPG